MDLKFVVFGFNSQLLNSGIHSVDCYTEVMIQRTKNRIQCRLKLFLLLMAGGLLLPSGDLVAQAEPSENDESRAMADVPAVILIEGAGGSEDYRKVFTESCRKIESAARKAESDFRWIGGSEKQESEDAKSTAKERLQTVLEELQKGSSQLWIILVGHGTFDRKTAKFNLPGPDLSAAELNGWLEPMSRPIAIINCASASAPFINRLSAKDRIIVTATKSGFELNYTRFGVYFAEALTDQAADIDKDEQVSLLEAFLFASRRVEEFYRADSRLATEHALIDDNGDGKGTPLTFFKGIRVIKQSSDQTVPDGPVANRLHLIQSEFEKLISKEVRKLRNQLESKLDDLRARKDELDEEAYMEQLEETMLQLSRLYRDIEQQQQGSSDSGPPKPEGKQTSPKSIQKKDENQQDPEEKKKAAGSR